MVISPKITRNVIDIHPLAGFLSILVGGAILGWIGALVAVPVCATIVAFSSAFVRKHDVIVEIEPSNSKNKDSTES
jgi:predicted PurR-regulated permease PerM